MTKQNAGKRISGKKRLLGVIGLLIVALMMTACSSSKETAAVAYSEDVYRGGTSQPQASSAPQADGIGMNGSSYEIAESINPTATQRKIIKDGSVSLETLNFEESLKALNKLIEDVGGYSENRTVQGRSITYQGLRSAYYVIRVPAECFEQVLNSMGSIGTVLEVSDQGTDITDTYMDLETRVKNLKVQEQTLLELMAKATKLEDVITLEGRITEVRYEIERIENTLKNYDSLVAYSRITINLYEVTERNETKPVPRTLGDRISGSFIQSLEDAKNGLEDFLVWLAGAWIDLLLLVLLGVVILLVIRKRVKARKPVKPTTQETTPTEPKE